MARRRRIGLKDIPQHVIQRGNDRKPCFAHEEDYIAYIGWLKQFSKKYHVAIHAWVLMTNHVHLLCTPLLENNGVSLMMQSLGRMYVRYFNVKYERTGTLWEGRFKSCLVSAPDYLLRVYKYIELNPVRANMVAQPAEYKWSSYQINALGKESDLCQAHDLYLKLGTTKQARLRVYRDLFANQVSSPLIDNIRKCTNKELVLGNDRFKSDIEVLIGTNLKSDKRGRPHKTVFQ